MMSDISYLYRLHESQVYATEAGPHFCPTMDYELSEFLNITRGMFFVTKTATTSSMWFKLRDTDHLLDVCEISSW